MRYPYEESRYEIPVPGMAAGARFRIALLSDLHNCSFEGILPLLEAAEPDIVLCAGDMINCPKYPGLPSWDFALAFYAKAAERYPVYAVPGNHEERWRSAENSALRTRYGEFCEQLTGLGVGLLENSCVTLQAGGTEIVLCGAAFERSNYRVTRKGLSVLREGQLEAMLGQKPEAFTVLCAHTPNAVSHYAQWGADLVLSGHVHGGIVRIRGKHGLVGPGFVLFPTYSKGKYTVGRTTLLVSAGLGEHSLPLRVGNPRHIVYADLTGTEQEEEGRGV